MAKSKKKKVVEPVIVNLPECFLPIELIEPVFERASYVVSLSQPFLFFDSVLGEVQGRIQRYDREVNGTEIMPFFDAFSMDNKYLGNVTHFKTI